MGPQRPLYRTGARANSVNMSQKLDDDLRVKNSMSVRNKNPNSLSLDKSYKEAMKLVRENSVKMAASTTAKQAATPAAQTAASSSNENGDWITPRGIKRPKLNDSPSEIITSPNNFSVLADTNMQTDEVNETSNTNDANSKSHVSNSQENNKLRPPAINVHNVQIKKIIETLNVKVDTNCYYIKTSHDNNHVIYPDNTVNHTKIIDALKLAQIQFFTYTPKNLQKKHLVLKGLNNDFNHDEVLTEINKLNLTNITIEKIEKMKINTSRRNNSDVTVNNFIIHLSNDSNIQQLTSVRKLLNQIIRWEPLRKKKIFQCYRCQRVGHASINCSLPARCVKCGSAHAKGECTLKEKINKDVKCANCGEVGHPASYRGCSYLKHVENQYNQARLQNKEKHKERLRRFYNTTSSNMSYANITAGRSGFQFDAAPRQHQYNEFNEIQTMKNEIIGALNSKFDIVMQQVNDNTNKIDYILSQIDPNYGKK